MITVSDFVRETWEDYKSPTTSTFASRMTQCRQTVNGLEEALDMDRSGLTKMKKSVKALYNSGQSHVSNEAYLAENFENLGNMAKTKEQEAEIHTAFVRFSNVTRELSILMRTMMNHLNSIVLHPLDTFLKSHLKGVKGDLKKPFDKAWKDYDSKFAKIEKEKKQQAKDAGMVRTDVSGAEIAEDLEKERKVFQLHMCEYLIKVNDIRTKKGVDLLKNLMEFYKAQTNFFQEGLKTISHYQTFIEELNQKVAEVKQRQDNERRQLVELRDALKSSMASYKEQAHNRLSGGGWPACQASGGGYSLHQLQGNKMHGCERSGYLLKKSEGRMRRVWQKRKCIIKDGFMQISHSDEAKPPVKLNLLTCQVKLVQDDPGRKCFDLISSLNNRTYHFQSDDEKDMDEWISVLNNAREEVLMKAFTDSSSSPSLNQSVRELTTSIIDHIRRLPGNKHCCDCAAPDPEWLSVNLGVLICLECCGIHRDLGVHISRTQSMVIDDLGTSQLLLARIVSNKNFNEIMEATLPPDQKPKPNSNMSERKEFIRAKYVAHKYAIITCTERYDLMQDLKMAVGSLDVFSLLQVFAEGADLMTVLPDTELEETALHLAVREDHGNALPVIDFIAQNSAIGSLDQKNRDGNTALHVCAELNRVEAMKLLLRVRPDLASVKNKADKTALDIAKELGHTMCQELLKAALTGKKDLYEHINIDWDLIHDDQDFGDSDDDLDSTPDRQKPRSRPPSQIVNLEGVSLLTSKESLVSRERLDSDSKPPPPPPPSQGKPKKLHSYPIKYRNNKLGKAGTGLVLQSNHASNDNLNGGNNGGMGPAESSESLPPIPPRGKKPPPPPPSAMVGGGHSRNRSEPDISFLTAHKRTSSDPPPRPQPPDVRNTIAVPSGLKSAFTVVSHEGSDPRPFQHPRASLIRDDTGSAIRTHSLGRSESQPESCSEVDTPPPIPEPRARGRRMPAGRRCRALFDCDADNDDELTFKEGEIIIAIREEEDEWWEGQVEGDPKRRGLFPVSWVRVLD